MDNKRKLVIHFNRWNDPPIKIEEEMKRLSGRQRRRPIHLELHACCVGEVQAGKIADLILQLNKPLRKVALHLDHNKLEDIPESVWDIANLDELDLGANNIKVIPRLIAKLTKLTKLLLGFNPISVFPESVCLLEQLEQLDLSVCRLTALPSCFASLRNLTILNACENRLENFPEVICELRNLTFLRLNSNKLSSLPQSFANLRELRWLDISGNRFKEFPQVVCKLPNLESLYIWGNQLSELPLAITKLVGLKSLNFDRNSFTSFPLFLGDLPLLDDFTAHDNPLQGPQRGLTDDNLLHFLQQRREIARLSAIVAGGFCCEESNAWTQFLVRGLYDPRLFLFIFDFAFDLSILESGRKRGRFELDRIEYD